MLLGLLSLLGCKDTKKEETTTPKEKIELQNDASENQHQESNSIAYDNSWTTDIQLDNGEKWEANIETNEGVNRMLDNLKTQQTETLEAYHQVAKLLNDDKNYIAKSCTMKGASHDNLHIWLLPLIAKIDGLSKTATVEEAANIKKSIKDNISAYSDYFQ